MRQSVAQKEPHLTLVEDSENVWEMLQPQAIEAEEKVLGSILINAQALDKVVEILSPEDFYRTAHQLIFEAALSLYRKQDPVDIITVSEMLNDSGSLEVCGGRSYINDLALGVFVTENVEYHARIVHEKSTLRKLRAVSYEIAESVYQLDGEQTAENIVDKAQQAILDVAQGRLSDDIHDLIDILPDTYEAIEERAENKGSLMGLSSGFVDIDNLTSGFQKSDLIILAARPSMGKTALALNFVANAAFRQYKSALIFSLEMSKEQLAQRLLCAEAELDAQRVRTGYLNDPDFEKLGAAMGRMSEGRVLIDDSAGLTIMEMRAKARKVMVQTDYQLSLIVVDYLQLMAGSEKESANRVQEISTISRGLKLIARELNIPIIALSQLSRAVEQRQDKRPMLSDLRDSGSIEQDCDLAIFIYRDEYYNKDSERPGEADIIIAKQRNGPVGEVALAFQSNITKFKSMYSQARF